MCYNPQQLPTKRYIDGKLVRDGVRIVACGKCIQCIESKSYEWAYRCMQEAKQHKENCMLTLTYSNAFLPPGGSLVRKDLTDFIKRLRKLVSPVKIRFFYCGEYGKQGKRPHYHVLVFGWKPKDMYFWQRDKSGATLYRSPTIEKLWRSDYIHEDFTVTRESIGFSSVGDVTFESCKYCAKYLQKMTVVPEGCVPAFTGQSLKPGLGFSSISPDILLRGCICLNGRHISIPRYFLKKLEEGHDLEEWKKTRYDNFIFKIRTADPYFHEAHKKNEIVSSKLLTKK